MIQSTLHNYHNTINDYQENINNSSFCILLWRRNQLLVRPCIVGHKYCYQLNCKELLVDCLNHSPVNLVRIDPQLGEEQLNLWANACQEVNKPIYLRIPSANIKYNISYLFRQWLQLSTNWLLAFILFLLLMPFLIPLVIWIKISGHQSLFTYEWRVGKRGKLFRVIALCATEYQQINSKEDLISSSKDLYIRKKQINLEKFMQMMRRYGINKLPQLLNVLRGDMMLFGCKCWALRDAISLSLEQQKQLNQMPGIISLSQVND